MRDSRAGVCAMLAPCALPRRASMFRVASVRVERYVSRSDYEPAPLSRRCRSMISRHYALGADADATRLPPCRRCGYFRRHASFRADLPRAAWIAIFDAAYFRREARLTLFYALCASCASRDDCCRVSLRRFSPPLHGYFAAILPMPFSFDATSMILIFTTLHTRFIHFFRDTFSLRFLRLPRFRLPFSATTIFRRFAMPTLFSIIFIFAAIFAIDAAIFAIIAASRHFSIFSSLRLFFFFFFFSSYSSQTEFPFAIFFFHISYFHSPLLFSWLSIFFALISSPFSSPRRRHFFAIR